MDAAWNSGPLPRSLDLLTVCTIALVISTARKSHASVYIVDDLPLLFWHHHSVKCWPTSYVRKMNDIYDPSFVGMKRD